MKITGARHEDFSAMRKRALTQGAAAMARSTPRADTTAFLGVPEAELTAAVRSAIAVLSQEISDLRGEVGRLKARLSEVEGLADRDSLTPLLNRRAFMRELSRVQAFAQRYGSPASLVYFDLDGLKGLNDRFGHAAGDAALKAVAERLTANVRESDVVGRMGGDEFAVVLVQTDLATAQAKAQALVGAIMAEPLRVGEAAATIQMSFGLQAITSDREPEALVAGADTAMYVQKRDRKTVASR